MVMKMVNKKTQSLRKLLKYISLGILLTGAFVLLDVFYETEDSKSICILGLVIGMVTVGFSVLMDFILGWKKVFDARKRIITLFSVPYVILLALFFLFSLLFLGDLKKDFIKTALFLAEILSAGAIPVSLVVLYFIWDSKDIEDNQESAEANLFNSIFTNLTGLSKEKDKDTKKYKKYHRIYVASIIVLVILMMFFKSRIGL